MYRADSRHWPVRQREPNLKTTTNICELLSFRISHLTGFILPSGDEHSARVDSYILLTSSLVIRALWGIFMVSDGARSS